MYPPQQQQHPRLSPRSPVVTTNDNYNNDNLGGGFNTPYLQRHNQNISEMEQAKSEHN